MTESWYHKECEDLCKMAAIYAKHGRYRLAENSYKLAIAMREKNGDDSLDLALAYYSLAELYSDQQQYEKAVPLFKQAVGIYEKQNPADALSILWYSDALAKLQKRFEEKSLAWQLLDEDRAREA